MRTEPAALKLALSPDLKAALVLLVASSLGLVAVAERAPAAELGPWAKWAKMEIRLTGPDSRGRGTPNPFAILVDGVFTSPSGKTFTVPGFYDGDGQGGLDGNVWKVRFAADEIGAWTFHSRSDNRSLNGQTVSFTVVEPPAAAPDFYRWGRLEAVGTAENKIRYLKFRDGPYWLKAGCDDPENFLGRYANYDTPAERRAAIDYLAARGINSFYIMSHNLDGDDKDVWPWLGATDKEAKAHSVGDVRFDVAKLAEWREIFEYMQQRGVAVYLILEDDSAWKGYDHARYYRELIARFGDLPALLFNLGEEHNENYKLPDGLALAGQLAEADPYDHPRGIHNVNTPHDAYIDAPQLDFTAIQTGSPGTRRGLDNALQHNQLALDWLRRCESRGQRVLILNFDEGRPEETRAAWWAAYLAGGVWEAHVLEPYDRPMSAWEKTWTELGGARAFLESLPFPEMQPHNELVTRGRALCLAKLGEAYALYLPEGGSIELQLPTAAFRVEWWDPAQGATGTFADGGRTEGGRSTLTAPSSSDWGLRITRIGP